VTRAFDRFMKQASSQGREYGDGFNSSHFEGLTESELAKAILILEEKAVNGDTIAINAVRLIGRRDAEAILEKVLSGVLSRKAVNQACFEAYKITKHRNYLDRIFESIDSCSGQDKWHCVQLLCSIEYGPALYGEFRKFFEKIVLDEQDEILRHSAARKILLEAGVLDGTPAHREKIRQLINERREVRERALLDLSQQKQ